MDIGARSKRWAITRHPCRGCPAFWRVTNLMQNIFLKSSAMAQQHSDTLKLGDAAPAFSLSAANQPGLLALADAHARGPAIVEFLRGTW